MELDGDLDLVGDERARRAWPRTAATAIGAVERRPELLGGARGVVIFADELALPGGEVRVLQRVLGQRLGAAVVMDELARERDDRRAGRAQRRQRQHERVASGERAARTARSSGPFSRSNGLAQLDAAQLLDRGVLVGAGEIVRRPPRWPQRRVDRLQRMRIPGRRAKVVRRISWRATASSSARSSIAASSGPRRSSTNLQRGCGAGGLDQPQLLLQRRDLKGVCEGFRHHP